jgi:hypothetical protein
MNEFNREAARLQAAGQSIPMSLRIAATLFTWRTSTHEQHARFVDRLGNHTLLDPSRNRDLGSLGFQDKAAVFQKSGYLMTNRITAAEWPPEAIDARQREMAGWAATVWKF